MDPERLGVEPAKEARLLGPALSSLQRGVKPREDLRAVHFLRNHEEPPAPARAADGRQARIHRERYGQDQSHGDGEQPPGQGRVQGEGAEQTGERDRRGRAMLPDRIRPPRPAVFTALGGPRDLASHERQQDELAVEPHPDGREERREEHLEDEARPEAPAGAEAR